MNGQWQEMREARLALDHFAARSRTSQLWMLFMEAGAKHPATLGRELAPVLDESLFLTHADYCYGGILLFAALHKAGDAAQRERLEMQALELPQTARFLHDEPREPRLPAGWNIPKTNCSGRWMNPK